MIQITELFGLNCQDETLDFKTAVNTQICPYTKRICAKMRKSDPSIKIGTCSVKYQNKNIIICPFRLLENHQIFKDCLHLMAMHEPGNELYLVPEVKIPGGNVDYFLISAKDKKIRDFCGIELQAMDTIGTLWPERQKFLKEKGIEIDLEGLNPKKSFGMNWKMTLKTTLLQMHHKSETFESLKKHLVLIVQKPLYEYMRSHFNFEGIDSVRDVDPIHIHSYDFEGKENHLQLSLNTRVSTDSAGIARSLGMNSQNKMDINELIQVLEPKLKDGHRLDVQ